MLMPVFLQWWVCFARWSVDFGARLFEIFATRDTDHATNAGSSHPPCRRPNKQHHGQREPRQGALFFCSVSTVFYRRVVRGIRPASEVREAAVNAVARTSNVDVSRPVGCIACLPVLAGLHGVEYSGINHGFQCMWLESICPFSLDVRRKGEQNNRNDDDNISFIYYPVILTNRLAKLPA